MADFRIEWDGPKKKDPPRDFDLRWPKFLSREVPEREQEDVIRAMTRGLVADGFRARAFRTDVEVEVRL